MSVAADSSSTGSGDDGADGRDSSCRKSGDNGAFATACGRPVNTRRCVMRWA